MQMNDIYVVYGSSGKKMVLELLEKIDIRKDIPTDSLIGIKPNLVTPKPSDSGSTTDPEMVAAVIEYLQSNGFDNVIILESAWHGARSGSDGCICCRSDEYSLERCISCKYCT